MDMFDVLFAKAVSGGGGAAPTLITKDITANGEYSAVDDDADGYSAVTVNVGGSVAEKDVNFYDYDGTVVASYTAAEFTELTAMPDNPTHEGLTAQGWNWSLSDAKTYVASYGKLNIGQMYITSDGKTRLYIRLGEGRLKPYLGLTGNSSGTAVSIDWGDNSNAESVTLNTSTVYTPHNYSAAGEYVIAITVTNGSISFSGDSSAQSNIFRKSSTPNANDDRVYRNILTKLEIGSGITFISTYAFRNCNALTSVTIPSGVTSIDIYAFSSCYALTSVVIPNSVTSISSGAFNNCYGFSFVKFERSTPPTVSNINAWTNIPTDCIIYVPTGSLSAYKSAANYPSSSTYTYVEY